MTPPRVEDVPSGALDATHRWENRERGRYYEVRLVRDLFGELQLMRVWGGLGNAWGALRWEFVADAEIACMLLASTEKRRAQRGYQPVCRPT